MDILAPTLGFQFASVGIEKGDRVMFYFALGIYATTMGLFGLRHIGALPIDMDVRAGSELLLKFADTTRASWLVCTPSLAQYMAEKAPSILGKEVCDLGLKGLKLTGEPWASIPEVKGRIEETYGCRAYDFYAVCGVAAGVSCDSDEYHGLHAHAPHLCTTYQDLVDPATKEPIDIVDGAVGEIVVTMLQRKACPLIKYAYGDIVQISTKECPGCGFKGPRVKIVGRADDMLIVKGSNVLPRCHQKGGLLLHAQGHGRDAHRPGPAPSARGTAPEAQGRAWPERHQRRPERPGRRDLPGPSQQAEGPPVH